MCSLFSRFLLLIVKITLPLRCHTCCSGASSDECDGRAQPGERFTSNLAALPVRVRTHFKNADGKCQRTISTQAIPKRWSWCSWFSLTDGVRAERDTLVLIARGCYIASWQVHNLPSGANMARACRPRFFLADQIKHYRDVDPPFETPRPREVWPSRSSTRFRI